MIEYCKGNLFESNADALAHGCNTKGRMNAGIAAKFKEEFSEMYEDYKIRCRRKKFKPGEGYMFSNKQKPHVINLATQDYGDAYYEYIESSLEWLANNYSSLGIESVAMPKIGTGLGGLEWSDVLQIIRKHFEESKLHVEIWEC